MNKKIYMSDLHFEHKVWKSQMEFQKSELDFFVKRLSEVANRWTDKDVLKQVEHLQNVFKIQNNQLDELLHDIHVHEDELVDRTLENPVAIDHVHFEDHTKQREQIETQNKIFADLKAEYMDFLRESM